MKVSVILLDWGVRESFHSIDYLNDQCVGRKNYELVWVEYFERKVPVLEEHHRLGRLDKYLILGNKPGDYHKHAAWNTGVLNSSGDIVVLCDSDAMFKNSFIKKIIDFFKSHKNLFLYIDEIRSENKYFWPFSYPTWEEVMAAPGLANWDEKRRVTTGLAPEYRNLPLYRKMFLRNYGACFCVKKSDYIQYGGLDEHDSYVGYICGPYDLAVRMINGGIQENWHNEEFILHTYHPRERPDVDRLGPHFRNNSTTSLKHLFDGNTIPYDENNKIRHLRRQMFPEPHRGGSPKFSVIVPGARSPLIQRLYDSVRHSTKLPYEVIFIGEENYPMNDEGWLYIKFHGSITESIIEGCLRAKGEIIVIGQPRAFFRLNALDSLLDSQKKLEYPVVYLNIIETFSEGFNWQQCLDPNDAVWPMIAFNRELLSDEPTRSKLEIIISNAKKTGTDGKDSIHVEIWHDNAYLYDNNLQLLLDKMSQLEQKFFRERVEIAAIYEAEKLFNQIYTVERNAPGNFLRYCFLKKYSIKEFLSFLGTFIHLNRAEVMVEGLLLLIEGASAFVNNIDTTIRETPWLHEALYSGVKVYIGAAHYNLAVWELNRNEKKKAVLYLKLCLEYIPDFSAAIEMLKKIYGKKHERIDKL